MNVLRQKMPFLHHVKNLQFKEEERELAESEANKPNVMSLLGTNDYWVRMSTILAIKTIASIVSSRCIIASHLI